MEHYAILGISAVNLICVIILVVRKPHEVVVTRNTVKDTVKDRPIGEVIMTPNGPLEVVAAKRKTIVNDDESIYNKENGI